MKNSNSSVLLEINARGINSRSTQAIWRFCPQMLKIDWFFDCQDDIYLLLCSLAISGFIVHFTRSALLLQTVHFHLQGHPWIAANSDASPTAWTDTWKRGIWSRRLTNRES